MQTQLMIQRAIQALQSQNYKDAEIIFKKVLQFEKNNVPALQMLGLTMSIQKKYDEAIKYLKLAAKLDPKNPSLQYNLAKSLTDAGFEKESLQHHQIAVDLDSKNINARLNFGKTLLKLNYFDQAVQKFTEVLDLDPNNFDAHITITVALVKLKYFDRALEHLEICKKINPNSNEVFFYEGSIQSELNYFKDALECYKKALIIKPDYYEAICAKVFVFLRLHDLDNALKTSEEAINLRPDLADAYNNKGLVLFALEKYDASLSFFEKALKLNPDFAEAWLNKGNALHQLNYSDESLTAIDKSLAIKKDIKEALLCKALVLLELSRYDEALISIDKALELNPDFADAWLNKGIIFQELKFYNKALNLYDKAIELKDDYKEALLAKANLFFVLKRFDDTFNLIDKAIELKNDYKEALLLKAKVFGELKRYDEALKLCDSVISLKENYPDALLFKATIFNELKKYEDALIFVDKAIAIKNNYKAAWFTKGNTLNVLKQHALSAKCYLTAFELDENYSYSLGKANHQMMLICNWGFFDDITQKIFNLLGKNKKVAEPFGFQAIAESEYLLKKCAEIYSADLWPPQLNLSKNIKYKHDKIRIGYLCGEFRNQATTILMARIWELHDSEKFEIYAFDNGWDDGSDYRQRINKAFKKVISISNLSDNETVDLIKSFEIDILVNLNGFFGLSRQAVFSCKPAPIQVNYLGFPGTIGATYIDYLIADRTVIPEDSRQFYTEKIVYLPDSYQANDDQRKISSKCFSRSELSLPQNSFVFACFNNNYKITPTTFDSWCRVLNKVDGSVLWLLKDSPVVVDNLKLEATKRGVDADRLIFADRASLPDHLSRQSLADLFLDTWPYNAHTTASDALWAGLPLVTLIGQTFPSRVAASLLKAINLPELIATSQIEYEALAIDLALNPNHLNDIKHKLLENRRTTPLFDSTLFTKNLESAYFEMAKRYEMDLNPVHIIIN